MNISFDNKGMSTGKSIFLILGVLLIILLLLIGGAGCIGCSKYNVLVKLHEAVNSQWGNVENVYQRRLDLIPNLVATVKGYAAHEKETLQSVIEARSKISQMKISSDILKNPNALKKFQEAQSGLSSALSRLMVVVERYPNLKANQNFLALQSQLEGTENRIAVERRRFNEMAKGYNSKIKSIPDVFIARLMGYTPIEYFKSKKGAETAPKVKF